MHSQAWPSAISQHRRSGTSSCSDPEPDRWTNSSNGSSNAAADCRSTNCPNAPDIDELAGRLRDSGVAPDAEPARHDRVDTVMIRDPDGNSIAFAMPKDPSLAQ